MEPKDVLCLPKKGKRTKNQAIATRKISLSSSPMDRGRNPTSNKTAACTPLNTVSATKIEAIAIVGERAAVNLQDERVFFGGIEIGRLDDPAFDFAFVEGGVVPKLFDGAENDRELGQPGRPEWQC